MKLHPFGMHDLLRSALVLKGCNFIAPLALMLQFLVALFSPIFMPNVMKIGVCQQSDLVQ